MLAKISLVLGLLVPALVVSQVLSSLKSSSDSFPQPTYRVEPVLYQTRACDPVNDPASCKPS